MSSAPGFVSLDCEGRSLDIEYQWLGDAAGNGPLLAVQGVDDEYGTLEQVLGIARRVAQTEVVELADCGHSPHRDQTQELIRIATGFVHDIVATGAMDGTEKYA